MFQSLLAPFVVFVCSSFSWGVEASMTSFRDAMGMNQPPNRKYLSAGGISRIWREQTKRGPDQQQKKNGGFFSFSHFAGVSHDGH
jgi:hypothetical protein